MDSFVGTARPVRPDNGGVMQTKFPESYSPPAMSWWCDHNMHSTCTEYSRLPCNCKCHPEIEVTEWCYEGDHDECNYHDDPCECLCHPEEDGSPYIYEDTEPSLEDDEEDDFDADISPWCQVEDHVGCNEQPDPCACECHPEETDE